MTSHGRGPSASAPRRRRSACAQSSLPRAPGHPHRGPGRACRLSPPQAPGTRLHAPAWPSVIAADTLSPARAPRPSPAGASVSSTSPARVGWTASAHAPRDCMHNVFYVNSNYNMYCTRTNVLHNERDYRSRIARAIDASSGNVTIQSLSDSAP